MQLEGAQTADSINFISIIQSNKKRLPILTEQYETFVSSEKILERQRYPFPAEWLHVEQLEGEWEAYRSILNRRDAAIAGQVSNLQLKVVNEERHLESQIAALVQDWDKNKPVAGDQNPDEAVNLLNIFEGRFVRLKDDQELLIKSKSALDLDLKVSGRLGAEFLFFCLDFVSFCFFSLCPSDHSPLLFLFDRTMPAWLRDWMSCAN